MAKTTKPTTKAAKPATPLTKDGLLAAVAEITGTSKKDVGATYEALLTVIAKETKRAGLVLPGLGKFSVAQRKARKGRNPATKEEIKIPAKKVVKFKVSKIIQTRVLGK